MRCQAKFEREAHAQGFIRVAGVDEVGRGALFGPVFAAAVILSPDKPIRGLRDSKQLDRERREVLAGRIRERAVSWAVGTADAFEIDHINIYQASRLAMRRAVERLSPSPDYLLIDAITVDHIYTCYRLLGWPTDIPDFAQPLRWLKHQQLFTSPERGKYAINHLGLDRAEKPNSGGE